nr:MAG TPA: hypothetical protein [Caudoviricetes sp.]
MSPPSKRPSVSEGGILRWPSGCGLAVCMRT